MDKKLNLEKLLQVYCEGIYAMDPKTAWPFWDYDFGPIYGDLWIKKILKAMHRAEQKKLTPKIISGFFENIAVPRKELIYSLVDLKVGKVPKAERIFFVNFWWDVVCQMCVADCMAEHSNIVHTPQETEKFIKTLPWEKSDLTKARQVGNLAMNLNSLAYGLYTDIYAHNSMENFGAYDVSKFFAGQKHILVIKQWANLRPVELYPEFANFPFDKLNIFVVYKDIDYTVDIYTHQIYSGNAAQNLVQYCVMTNEMRFENNLAYLQTLNEYLGKIATEHYLRLHKAGFEEAKKIWVLARNYQFKDFFRAVGMEWRDTEMLERVKDTPLLKTDFWNFEKYPKEILFTFWKQCFDPRLDTYYDEWKNILNGITSKK